VSLAVTDLGEMRPLIVLIWVSTKSSAGLCGTVVVVDAVLAVDVGATVVREVEVDDAAGSIRTTGSADRLFEDP
jgi:hypothetical protein